ncbi:hypothetical protein [Mesorhizobium sp.]|uniref:hypothetical protein n=1 Tax=Mesorhizobium sp. TaxID=1871066 RepID=UPI00257C8278|nr:hypothetical protein [Mesorhizobium sp.]
MNDTIAKRVEFAHLLDEAIALGKVIRFGGGIPRRKEGLAETLSQPAKCNTPIL